MEHSPAPHRQGLAALSGGILSFFPSKAEFSFSASCLEIVYFLHNPGLAAHPSKDKCWLERKGYFILEAGNLGRRQTPRINSRGERGS